MKIAFTRTNLLLQRLYAETGVTENQAIDRALDADYSLSEEFHAFEDVKAALSTISLRPQASTIDAIMAYSKKTNNLQPAC